MGNNSKLSDHFKPLGKNTEPREMLLVLDNAEYDAGNTRLLYIKDETKNTGYRKVECNYVMSPELFEKWDKQPDKDIVIVDRARGNDIFEDPMEAGRTPTTNNRANLPRPA